jgi:putative Ca2+/H+ antiporter (TMEM165/GDT1 family)
MSESLRLFIAAFASVFVAELGDKTQLATMALSGGASGARTRFVVFLGAALALVATSAIGVLAGAAVGRFVSPAMLRRIGGVLFLVMGAWMLVTKA